MSHSSRSSEERPDLAEQIQEVRDRMKSTSGPTFEQLRPRWRQRADSLPTSGRLGTDPMEHMEHLERVKSGDIKDLHDALGKVGRQPVKNS